VGTDTIRGIVYGNGIYVAIAAGSLSTSTDGITWTTRGFGGSNNRAVAYNSDVYVAVGTNGELLRTTDPLETSFEIFVNWNLAPTVTLT
jgi:hypothetical protein